MDNEQIFELMTKMYADMQQGFKKSDERFNKLESDVKKIGTKIDGDITPKIEALFDGYKQNTEQLTRIENNVNTLSDKVDKHDIKIQVIEGGKGKNIK